MNRVLSEEEEAAWRHLLAAVRRAMEESDNGPGCRWHDCNDEGTVTVRYKYPPDWGLPAEVRTCRYCPEHAEAVLTLPEAELVTSLS